MFDYKKIAASPISTLSQLYHTLLDTTHIPNIPLTKEYKNELYLSINEWKNKLPSISVDAVNEECASVIDKLSWTWRDIHIMSDDEYKQMPYT